MKTALTFSISILLAVYLVFAGNKSYASEWDLGEHIEESDTCDSVIFHYDGSKWTRQMSGTSN